jgi:hypothetical protein
VGGTLSPGDCTIAQLGIDPGDTSWVDVYRIQVGSPGFLTVQLDSAAFDTFLYVYDGTLTELLDLDDDSGGGSTGTNSLISALPVAAGTYLVLANSFFSGETGPYTLTTSFVVNTACAGVVDLAPSAVAQGTLSAQDCTLSQLGVDPLDDSFVDQYRVSLPAGGPLTVQLDSNAFDAFLFVYDDTLGELLALDDDSGPLNNALLSELALGPGSYRILATSFQVGEIGAYTLTLLPEPCGALIGAIAVAAAAGLARARRGPAGRRFR